MTTTLRKTRPEAEIISDPTVMGGEPVIRGTRIPAATIVAYLEAGYTDMDIFSDYPSLPADGIDAVRRWHEVHNAQTMLGPAKNQRQALP
jgi:uncharacterized protein (DUF433 family)